MKFLNVAVSYHLAIVQSRVDESGQVEFFTAPFWRITGLVYRLSQVVERFDLLLILERLNVTFKLFSIGFNSVLWSVT